MEELTEIETKDDKQKRKIPVILFVLVILLLIAGCVYALLAPAISNVFENILEEGALVGDDFLGALKDGEYDKAYSLLHPDLQREVDGPESLEANFPSSLIDSWEHEAEGVTSESGDSAVRLIGVLSLTDGSQLNMQIVITWDGDEGQITGYSFQSK